MTVASCARQAIVSPLVHLICCAGMTKIVLVMSTTLYTGKSLSLSRYKLRITVQIAPKVAGSGTMPNESSFVP